jgi:hypothetical protein
MAGDYFGLNDPGKSNAVLVADSEPMFQQPMKTVPYCGLVTLGEDAFEWLPESSPGQINPFVTEFRLKAVLPVAA